MLDIVIHYSYVWNLSLSMFMSIVSTISMDEYEYVIHVHYLHTVQTKACHNIISTVLYRAA
jgi:hypothetical protein